MEGSPDVQVNASGESDSGDSEIIPLVRVTTKALICPPPSRLLVGSISEPSDEPQGFLGFPPETQEHIEVCPKPSNAGPARKRKRRNALQLLLERKVSWERDGWIK